MLWLHGSMTLFWIALWGTAMYLGWLKSVVFVSHLSVIALVLASASAWQGARAESKADAGD